MAIVQYLPKTHFVIFLFFSAHPWVDIDKIIIFTRREGPWGSWPLSTIMYHIHGDGWLAGWIGGGGALRKHNALGYSCHRDGGIKVTYALVCLCGWCKKKKKSPPTTISEHKNNKRDLCCVAVASISDKLSQWGVNAASLIHGSLSMSFWTAEMSPSLRVLSAPHWTCHHQIIARCLSVCPSQTWKWQTCCGRRNIWHLCRTANDSKTFLS